MRYPIAGGSAFLPQSQAQARANKTWFAPEDGFLSLLIFRFMVLRAVSTNFE
jgi:hypothetical protein